MSFVLSFHAGPKEPICVDPTKVQNVSFIQESGISLSLYRIVYCQVRIVDIRYSKEKNSSFTSSLLLNDHPCYPSPVLKGWPDDLDVGPGDGFNASQHISIQNAICCSVYIICSFPVGAHFELVGIA